MDIKKKELANHPTALLWLQYMDMVALLRHFIEVERTGNWELHLQSLRDTLSFYAATGHNLYAKSVYAYLQQMLELKTKHADILRPIYTLRFVVPICRPREIVRQIGACKWRPDASATCRPIRKHRLQNHVIIRIQHVFVLQLQT